jgi:hypothetical protein
MNPIARTTAAMIHPRLHAGEQKISAYAKQIKSHQQPEEIAPRGRPFDGTCSDPEQRAEEPIGERPPVATHMPP